VTRFNASHAPLELRADPPTHRQATVHSVTGSIALLSVTMGAGCAGCERQQKNGRGPGHCGIDLLGLAKPNEHQLVPVPVPKTLNLSAGDTVLVQVPSADTAWLSLTLWVYGVPTLGLVLGVSAGSVMGDSLAIAGGFIGLWAGLWLGRRSVHVPQSMLDNSGPVCDSMRIVNTVTELRS